MTKLPLVLFIWGPYRIVPVRISALSIAETEYDQLLNPIRAEINVSLEILTPSQLADEQVGLGAYKYSEGVKEVMAALNLANAAQIGVSTVEFLNADVQVQDLGTKRFDAAYSRFGVMFFEDPVAAFANVRRALRPEGVLSFVCWQSVFDNEWMLIPGVAVASVTGSLPPMPGPGEPGPFSLADPDRVQSVLSEAGFTHVDVMAHADELVIAEDDIAEVALSRARVGAAREALRDADDQTRQHAVTAIEEAFRSRVNEGQVHTSRGVLLVVARA